MHQRPGFKPGLMLGHCATVISLSCLKDLVSSQGFNVGIQSNIWTVFYAPETWLQARVLMLGYCTTCTSKIWFQAGLLISVYNQTYETKTWLQARVLMLWYCTTVTSLPCFKNLVSSQGFNVGIQSNIWTVFHLPKTWLQVRFYVRTHSVGKCLIGERIVCWWSVKDNHSVGLMIREAGNLIFKGREKL